MKKIKAKIKTTSLVAIAVLLLIVSTVNTADAEPTQMILGSVDGISVSIMHDDISNTIILEKDGLTSEHWDGVIKTYNSGGFVIKNIESGIVLFAHPIGNEQYRLVVITNDSVYRLIGVSEIISESDAIVTPSSSYNDEPISSVGTDITKYDIPTDTVRGGPTGTDKQLQLMVKTDYVSSFFINEEYNPNISVVNYWKPSEGIKDVITHLEISRADSILVDREATTSSVGKWNPSVDITYPKYYPTFCYDVKITAQYGNATATFYDDFLVLTTAKYYSSTDEYGIGESAISSDSDCNDDDAR